MCGFTIVRDLNATINIMRRGMQILNKTVDENETEHIGRGTPEVMPVETGQYPQGQIRSLKRDAPELAKEGVTVMLPDNVKAIICKVW